MAHRCEVRLSLQDSEQSLYSLPQGHTPIILVTVQIGLFLSFERMVTTMIDHAEADLWLARRDGEVVGRIGASVDRYANEHHQEKVGFFGFYEADDDDETATALLTAARDWIANLATGEILAPWATIRDAGTARNGCRGARSSTTFTFSITSRGLAP